MNKKYQIVNFNSNEDCTIFYLLYIVLFFVIILIIYKVIFNTNNFDKFDLINYPLNNNTTYTQNVSTNNIVNNENINNGKIKKYIDSENAETNKSIDFNNNLGINENNVSSEKIISQLINKNNELTSIKNTIEEKLKEQARGIYISQNYNKIDSTSFEDELSFLLTDFANTKLPEITIDGKKIVQTQSEFDNVLAEIKEMKNFYKPGDIVTSNSTFGITKNDICYRSNGKPIKADADFISKFPDCMVCSVENTDGLKNTNTWKYTKTNINKVCLFNPTAEENSGIPNLKQCQNFCGIVSN